MQAAHLPHHPDQIPLRRTPVQVLAAQAEPSDPGIGRRLHGAGLSQGARQSASVLTRPADPPARRGAILALGLLATAASLAVTIT